MSEPRGRIQNGSVFEMRELEGRTISSLVAYRCGRETPEAVSVVGILLHGAPHWHRFFLDAGIGFWEEWPADEVFQDFDDCRRLDKTLKWPISGSRIIQAACELGPGSVSRFGWTLDNGKLFLSYSDETNDESETVLLFEAQT